MIKFTVLCLDNDKIYNESNFNILVNLYKVGKVSDDIRLLSISINLTRTYENEELYDMEDIDCIDTMQSVIKELNYINNLDSYTMDKLEAIFEYEDELMTTCVEHLNKYDFYDNVSVYDLAQEFCKNYENYFIKYETDEDDMGYAVYDYDGIANELNSEGYIDTEFGTLLPKYNARSI